MADDALRVDKWLWHARVTKTRSLAQKLVSGGKVRLNRNRLSAAHHPVRVGDVLTIATERGILVYEVLGLGERRGPYPEARLLYRDRSAASPGGEQAEAPY